jgi:serine acetyltransferase
MSKAVVDRTIQQDFGKPGEQDYKAYLRLVRRAVFSDAPAAFPACIRLAELARARGWSRTGAWVRHHMERRFSCYVHPHAEIGPGLRTPHRLVS